MLTKVCSVSGQEFTITDKDLEFYKKMEVPPPTLCPEERQRRRLAWQNMYKLYHRNCDATGKKIISNYAPNTAYKVYDQTYWWNRNEWDPLEYSRDFDFSKNFFPQLDALTKVVPHPNLDTDHLLDENSSFCNFAGQQRNCYLVFHASLNEDCLYGTGIKESTNIVDGWNVFYSELCYECVDCRHAYNLKFCQDCHNCSDSVFLKNCIGCKNSFGCINLKQKEYFLFNKFVGKEAFEDYMQKFKHYSFDEIEKLKIQFSDFQKTQPQKHRQGIKNEQVTGDHISECKNCTECFDIQESEDMKFCERIYNGPNSDCYDVDQFGLKIQQIYEGSEIGRNVQRALFCAVCRNQSHEIQYCFECTSCQNCFGCVGLHKKEYCLLNKQYSKEEYCKLRDRIIDHMKKTDEWGEFFPIEISPFSYNQTVAQEYFPLTKKEALKKGYTWEDAEENIRYQGSKVAIPDDIGAVPDEITDEILTCDATEKHYRIVKSELNFYRKMSLPLPRLCPDERHKRRMALRNPRKLWDRNCDQCGIEIKTSVDPERPEKVYCEKCYLKAVD